MRSVSGLIGCGLFALAIAGCGGTSMKTPSTEVQRDVAGRFAAAVLHGNSTGARELLVGADESALVFLVERAAAPWTAGHASIELPARHSGERWTFVYSGRRTFADGRFETEKGELVVFVAPSPSGAGVRFFGFRNVNTRFSTHHDAQLLPSKR